MGNRKKSRFSIAAIEPEAAEVRKRGGGPMSAAVRETAESLTEATEAKIEARKRNAEDAKAFRLARDEGLLIERVAIDEIQTDDLPRDRMDLSAVASSDEMDELKASIRAYGQKEVIEVYRDAAGALQLRKGWRRLTALRSLFDETGESQFATALVRIDLTERDRIQNYIDMVEENVIREDLSFAEMAQVAISAAADPLVDGDDADAHVARLYGSLHKVKRSYIRSFVRLLLALGDDLKFPKAVARNLGVEAERSIAQNGRALEGLRASLRSCATVEEQTAVLQDFASGRRAALSPEKRKAATDIRKYEFRVGSLKVTAKKGELRVKADIDYSEVPRARLERAMEAFQEALLKDE